MREGMKFARRVALPVVAFGVAVALADEALGPVPSPVENAPTEPKRVLGKMLFFEEQLSSDDSVACATCHVMQKGGTDPRRARNPGSNTIFGDLGDVMGSPGIEPLAENATFRPASDFGVGVQVTPRSTPTPFAAPFENEILWDGRAGSTFKDPDTGQVVIASGGALESQALLPLTNAVEMGHADRNLAQVTAKLASARPLALASNLPSDVALALTNDPSYAELFSRAFGDPSITPARIAMAIATYERTLVADQTKYDLYAAGDPSALSPQEARGLLALTTSKCVTCHVPPLFTDGTFRATGVRSPSEDAGRKKTTQNVADRGKFKVPTLRNVALKSSFFHDGQRTELGQAIDFYAVSPGPAVNGVRGYGSPSGGHSAQVPSEQFADNQDQVMTTITVTHDNALDIAAFLRGALVDPRVVSGTFPFDVPTLGSQRPAALPVIHGSVFSTGESGPQVVIRTPAFAGNTNFSVSLTGGSPGAGARLISWESPSADGRVQISDPIALSSANGVTYGNTTFSLAGAKAGSKIQFAWRVDDPSAPGGATITPTASVVVHPQRPQYSNGQPVSAPDVLTVDDGDAFVESAKFSADFQRKSDVPADDRFACVAWLGVPPAGTDLATGAVSLSIGGVEVLPSATMDAKGRISGPGVTGSFSALTGRLQLSLRGIDLRSAMVSQYLIPVRIEISGLALAKPVATTTLSFNAWTVGRTTGRFTYRAAGTGNGVFHVTGARAQSVAGGRDRVRFSAALNAPGSMSSWASGGATFTMGANAAYRVTANSLGVSQDGTTYSVTPDGDLRRLRIDVPRRVLEFDATVDLPELAAAAPGTTVRVPVTLSLRPTGTTSIVSFSTTATVLVTRKR